MNDRLRWAIVAGELKRYRYEFCGLCLFLNRHGYDRYFTFGLKEFSDATIFRMKGQMYHYARRGKLVGANHGYAYLWLRGVKAPRIAACLKLSRIVGKTRGKTR